MSARQFLNAIAVALPIGAVVSFSSSAFAQAARPSARATTAARRIVARLRLLDGLARAAA